ncbi:hypothetical protein KPL78_05745 [Roseomonas sp. HJA6]|uniref:Uncharacterized protein n=1 Tax=Roseomonas alba TaxID=2846776 RepID=A0ABS7A573_9PROT|nr:hypothetical protein [Neoroseomonas alba]MBW6397343.1 hypothetical protein [Neoroseomonas alba]
MATDPVPQIAEAIRLWSGVTCPNAAGKRGLEDFCALIKDFEAQRGTLVFEDEPSTFEAALRAEAESEA